MGGHLERVIWTRRYAFQSVHHLDAGAVRERRHGHEYLLEVSFTGLSIDYVDEVVGLAVLKQLHGRELTQISPASGEKIVDWAHDQLVVLGDGLVAVALQETQKNRFVSAKSEARYV